MHVNDHDLGCSLMLPIASQAVTLPDNNATLTPWQSGAVNAYVAVFLRQTWANVSSLPTSGPRLIPQSAFKPADTAFASFFPVDDFLLVLLEKFQQHNADADDTQRDDSQSSSSVAATSSTSSLSTSRSSAAWPSAPRCPSSAAPSSTVQSPTTSLRHRAASCA